MVSSLSGGIHSLQLPCHLVVLRLRFSAFGRDGADTKRSLRKSPYSISGADWGFCLYSCYQAKQITLLPTSDSDIIFKYTALSSVFGAFSMVCVLNAP